MSSNDPKWFRLQTWEGAPALSVSVTGSEPWVSYPFPDGEWMAEPEAVETLLRWRRAGPATAAAGGFINGWHWSIIDDEVETFPAHNDRSSAEWVSRVSGKFYEKTWS